MANSSYRNDFKMPRLDHYNLKTQPSSKLTPEVLDTLHKRTIIVLFSNKLPKGLPALPSIHLSSRNREEDEALPTQAVIFSNKYIVM